MRYFISTDCTFRHLAVSFYARFAGVPMSTRNHDHCTRFRSAVQAQAVLIARLVDFFDTEVIVMVFPGFGDDLVGVGNEATRYDRTSHHSRYFTILHTA